MPKITITHDNGQVETYEASDYLLAMEKEDGGVRVASTCSVDFIIELIANDILKEHAMRLAAQNIINMRFGKGGEANEADRTCNCRACHAARRNPIH